MEADQLPELLTIDQLASYMEVSRNTVYAWNTRGTGPRRIRHGRTVRYRREDVTAWLKEHTVAAA